MNKQNLLSNHNLFTLRLLLLLIGAYLDYMDQHSSHHIWLVEMFLFSAIAIAIQKQKPGEFIKLEKLNVAGKPFYEIEIKDSKGVEWEFMCNAKIRYS